MKKIRTSLYGLLLMATILFGCQGEDGDPGPQGEQGLQGDQGEPGPLRSGKLTGHVRLQNEAGAEILDRSGVTITVEGLTPAKSATSTAQGTYEIADLPEGIYQLTYTKAGYGTYKRFVIHSGGSTANLVPNTFMGKISTIGLENLVLTPDDVTGSPVRISGNFSAPPPGVARIRTFFSTDPNVSSTNYLMTSISNLTTTEVDINNFAIFSMTASHYEGIGSGTTIYMKLYLGNAESTYTDPATGSTIYPALGPGSEVLSYVIP